MSDTEQQSFQAWLRGHFTFDSHDLAEISNLIAVPGLSDVDMPDVLSLLTEQDEPQLSGMLNQLPSPPRDSLESSRPAAGISKDLTAAGPGQPTPAIQQVSAPNTQPYNTSIQHESPFQIRVQHQPCGSLQAHEYSVAATQQQTQQPLPQLPQQPSFFQSLDWAHMPHHTLANHHRNVTSAAHNTTGNGYNPAALMQPSSFNSAAPGPPAAAGFDQLSERGSYATLYPAGDALAATEPCLWSPGHRDRSSKVTGSGDGGAARSYSSSQSLSASEAKYSMKAGGVSRGAASRADASAGLRHPAGILATVGTAVGAPAAEGVVKRRKRKPSEAQRQAHRRFRQRRKEQVWCCVACSSSRFRTAGDLAGVTIML